MVDYARRRRSETALLVALSPMRASNGGTLGATDEGLGQLAESNLHWDGPGRFAREASARGVVAV